MKSRNNLMFLNNNANYQKKLLYLYSALIFLFVLYFLSINFINLSGYWFDEWCTLLNSDPNSNLKVIKERFWGDIDKPQEEVPIYYYLILRLFFKIFGYTSENGRFFSLIFYFFSTFALYFFLRLNFDKSKSLFISSFYFSTPFVLWMSNETRVDMFLIFFSIISLLFFFNCHKNNTIKNKILLCFFNFITLSIYPLTFSLVVTQIVFSIIKKKYDLIGIVILSFLIYAVLNYEYILIKSTTKGHHYATLENSFFIGYFFNKFFGSVLFGFIYLASCCIFFIRNFKKILLNDFILFIALGILFTYLMVISSSVLLIPIAAPRYIIFVIPLILIFLFSNIFLFEKRNGLLVLVFFILSILNLSLNYNKMPIVKPKTIEALELINNSKETNLYIEPQQKLFINYLSTIKKIDNFKIVKKNEIEKIEVKSFVVLCLNYPSSGYAIKPKNIHEDCLKDYYGYEELQKVNFNDFYIRYLKILN